MSNFEEYFREIKEIENFFYGAITHLDNTYPKPINGEEEKKKFFEAIEQGSIYNPQLQFKKKRVDKNIIQTLRLADISLKNDYYGIKKLYKEKIEQKIHELSYFRLWGKEESTTHVIKAKGKPTKTLVNQAKEFCRNYERQTIKFTRLSPKEVGDELKKEVKKLTGNTIKVRYQPLFNKMNINAAQNLITINKNEEFKSIEVERLKVHEIGTHYLRYYNGDLSDIKILRTGTANYIEIEEGLAAYMEELKGVATDAQMYIYAGRVIATHYSLTHSFYEIFSILKQYNFKDSDAYAITLRAKRNLKDTSLPGGFTKDYVYFSGYQKVKEYAKNNSLKKLFIGKIKLEDLELLEDFIEEKEDKLKTILDE